MRPITKFAIAGAVATALCAGVAFAAVDVGGGISGGSDSNAQGTTGDFRAGGAGSIETGGVVPLGGSMAADAHGNLGAGVPAGSVGSANAGGGGAGASTSVDTLAATHTAASTSDSATIQTSSLGSPASAIDSAAHTIESTVGSMNQLPFSTGGSAPILGVNVSGGAQFVASVP